jgi:hypothetical protein
MESVQLKLQTQSSWAKALLSWVNNFFSLKGDSNPQTNWQTNRSSALINLHKEKEDGNWTNQQKPYINTLDSKSRSRFLKI